MSSQIRLLIKSHYFIQTRHSNSPLIKIQTLADSAAKTSSSLKKDKERKCEYFRYPCDKCVYAATTARNLKQHLKSKDEGIHYPCDQCYFVDATASSLKAHKESKHEGKH